MFYLTVYVVTLMSLLDVICCVLFIYDDRVMCSECVVSTWTFEISSSFMSFVFCVLAELLSLLTVMGSLELVTYSRNVHQML